MKSNYRRFKRSDKGYSRVLNKAEIDRALTEEGSQAVDLGLFERGRQQSSASGGEVWDSNRLSAAMDPRGGNRLRGLEVIEQAVEATKMEPARHNKPNWFLRLLRRFRR